MITSGTGRNIQRVDLRDHMEDFWHESIHEQIPNLRSEAPTPLVCPYMGKTLSGPPPMGRDRKDGHIITPCLLPTFGEEGVDAGESMVKIRLWPWSTACLYHNQEYHRGACWNVPGSAPPTWGEHPCGGVLISGKQLGTIGGGDRMGHKEAPYQPLTSTPRDAGIVPAVMDRRSLGQGYPRLHQLSEGGWPGLDCIPQRPSLRRSNVAGCGTDTKRGQIYSGDRPHGVTLEYSDCASWYAPLLPGWLWNGECLTWVKYDPTDYVYEVGS